MANAPLADSHARMDDGADAGEVMWLHGQVKDNQGQPIANAIVDIWHANTLGNYSFSIKVGQCALADSHARMDDGADAGEVMWLHGQVKDNQGQPIANAIVDIWHANTLGNYSFFDQSQSDYNLRRRIRTGADGRYSVRSIMPSGYGCPPDGPTQKLLDQLGRHGNRPAHIHFFVSAPGHKHLTSQINLSGDKYLWDDFAFATRDGLIADPVKVTDRETIAQRDLEGEHTEVCFDFTLCKALNADEEHRGTRLRAKE